MGWVKAHFHWCMSVVWAMLAIPTVLVWNSSVEWVAFMSLYANFGFHIVAAISQRTAREVRENSDDSG